MKPVKRYPRPQRPRTPVWIGGRGGQASPLSVPLVWSVTVDVFLTIGGGAGLFHLLALTGGLVLGGGVVGLAGEPCVNIVGRARQHGQRDFS